MANPSSRGDPQNFTMSDAEVGSIEGIDNATITGKLIYPGKLNNTLIP